MGNPLRTSCRARAPASSHRLTLEPIWQPDSRLSRLLVTRARRVVAHRARCSCGYSSAELALRVDAADDWAMHVARAGELERELAERGELEGD
jgi:hypothetical protein